MYNVAKTWLVLIGTVQNATRLRARLTSLKSPPLDTLFGPEPLQCPLTVLYGAEVSRQVYANPTYRPALDAWDNGSVTPDDLRRWCLVIERGEYAGGIFSPELNAITVHSATRTMARTLADREYNRRAKGNVEKKKLLPRRGAKAPKPIDWSQLDL